MKYSTTCSSHLMHVFLSSFFSRRCKIVRYTPTISCGKTNAKSCNDIPSIALLVNPLGTVLKSVVTVFPKKSVKMHQSKSQRRRAKNSQPSIITSRTLSNQLFNPLSSFFLTLLQHKPRSQRSNHIHHTARITWHPRLSTH